MGTLIRKNKGKYFCKNMKRAEDYDLKKAVTLFNESVDGLKKNSSLTEVYLAALSFLAKSSEVGIYYR